MNESSSFVGRAQVCAATHRNLRAATEVKFFRGQIVLRLFREHEVPQLRRDTAFSTSRAPLAPHAPAHANPPRPPAYAARAPPHAFLDRAMIARAPKCWGRTPSLPPSTSH